MKTGIENAIRRGVRWGLILALASPVIARPLTPGEELELKNFTSQLADPARSAKTKMEAAELLLTRQYPEAAETLRKFLGDAGNRPAQIAVAEAVARQGGGHAAFIEPLLAMLTGTEPSVRQPAARALVTYRDEAVTAKLIAIATDRAADKTARLATIGAIQRVLDKQAVDALVRLVGDRDEAIRTAAADSLAKLTNIRTFGASSARWRRWWSRNKDKPASAWLADLAESLGRDNARLEAEVQTLRERLAKATTDLYSATAPAEQVRLLTDILKDPLPELRRVGLTLAGRRVHASGAPPPAELQAQIRRMLDDEDPGVQREAALLEANIGDPNAVDELLRRLTGTTPPEVKEALLTALGQLRSPKALGPILVEVQSSDEPVAAAAAGALARSAAAQPLTGKVRETAVKALLKRYHAADAAANGNGAALREALLAAMGAVADEKFVPALRAGLKDTAATVRLAAVKALAQFRQAELADAIVPLAGDEDRGVRQAALETLGTLGGDKHRDTLLKRTDPAAESDTAVREKAWAVLMSVLAKSDAATLTEVCTALAKRSDANSQRIGIRQMLVQSLRTDKSPKLSGALRELGQDLAAAQRPAEAATTLGEAYRLYAAAKDAAGKDVYLEWIDALLSANDPLVVKAMADPSRADVFEAVLAKLNTRLKALTADGRYAPAILTAREVVRQLPTRLTAAQRAALEKLAAEAEAQQLAADTQRVAELARQLLSTDAAVAKAAAGELKAMGDRAVQPLVQELRSLAAGSKPNVPAEKALVAVLVQIAPKLTGYDPAAPKTDRLRLLDGWLKTLKS